MACQHLEPCARATRGGRMEVTPAPGRGEPRGTLLRHGRCPFAGGVRRHDSAAPRAASEKYLLS